MSNANAVGIVGGTGALGSGLAYRLVKAGYPVIIGSRSAEKAVQAAAEIAEKTGRQSIRGSSNLDAARDGSIVIVTVPFPSHEATLEEMKSVVQGKIVIDVTVPLVPPRVARVTLPKMGSAAVAAQALLGESVRVVAAFHNVAATHLHDDGHAHECDVLVFGNDKAARGFVVEMSQAMGLKAWHAGSIDNAVVGEALTSVLIFMNKHYGIDGSGIKITGRPREVISS